MFYGAAINPAAPCREGRAKEHDPSGSVQSLFSSVHPPTVLLYVSFAVVTALAAFTRRISTR